MALSVPQAQGLERGFVRRGIYIGVLEFQFKVIGLGTGSCHTYNILGGLIIFLFSVSNRWMPYDHLWSPKQ